MGEAQQIEGLRLPIATRWWSSVRPAKFDEPGLLRMEREAVFAESLRQHVEHAACVLLARESQHCVVSVTDHECAAFQPRLHLPLKPNVEYLVQKDVRQDRRYDAALR